MYEMENIVGLVKNRISDLAYERIVHPVWMSMVSATDKPTMRRILSLTFNTVRTTVEQQAERSVIAGST